MRILVIGATGMIGAAVVAALSAGNQIVSASRRSASR
jgi:nucleoside-diphosphate-sugar epimerase